MSCGIGHRRGSDLAWLWLWRRQVATAQIQPLAWEPPYAEGVALEKAKTKKKKKKKKKGITVFFIFYSAPLIAPASAPQQVIPTSSLFP